MPAIDSVPLTDPATWVDAHGEAMFAFARLRLGSTDAAEEAVQDALVAAIEARNRFDGRSAERTWLIGILRHKVIDYVRKQTRLARMEGGSSEEFTASRALCIENRPDSRLDDAEYHAALHQAVLRLPDKMRLALVLREVDNLATEQVCEILDVTPTNLWTLIHRAKLRLREMMVSEPGGVK